MRSFAAATAALGLAFASPAHAGEAAGGKSWVPRDECRADPSAGEFLDALAAAVEARDSAALAALATEHVELDFGGGEGLDELRARLDGEREYYGDLWKELATLLSLGCASGGDGFIALPWYWSQDFGEADAFSTMLAIRPEVQVRATPSVKARVIATLHWNPVEVPGDYNPENKFTEVVLASGARGFAETAALRSLIDYRLLAEKTGDGWKISAFIAGD